MKHEMFNQGNPIKVFDGANEIIFSEVFCILGDELKIEKVEGYEFRIKFLEDKNDLTARYVLTPNDQDKVITVDNYNMQGSIGSGSTNYIPVFSFPKGKVVLAMQIQTINPATRLKTVAITFSWQSNV